MEFFERPAGFHEFDGEPVEEVGVGGEVALIAEVFLGFDEPAAEERGPVAVDDDAGG